MVQLEPVIVQQNSIQPVTEDSSHPIDSLDKAA